MIFPADVFQEGHCLVWQVYCYSRLMYCYSYKGSHRPTFELNRILSEERLICHLPCVYFSWVIKVLRKSLEKMTFVRKMTEFFFQVWRRSWDEHDIEMRTKFNMYEEEVLTTLLYLSETWTTISPYSKLLEPFWTIKSHKCECISLNCAIFFPFFLISIFIMYCFFFFGFHLILFLFFQYRLPPFYCKTKRYY